MSGASSGWRLMLLCGVLWGVAVMLAEMPTLPVSGLSAPDFAMFCCQSIVPWVSSGLVWALGVKVAEDHRRWILILLLPVTTCTTMLAKIGFAIVEPRLNSGAGELLRDVPIADIAPYFAWTNMVYGYLYVAGYLAARRRIRGRTLLAVQRRERSEADSALREARLASLRGQLQPDLLIEALHALQARFAHSPAAGDQMFDIIVAFLRAAMPGVRNHAAALSAELETVRRYSVLREVLGRPGVRLGPIEPGAAEIALPPLLLLPLVDQLARDAPAHGGPVLTTRCVAGTYTIAIASTAPDAPIAAALDALDLGVTTAGGDVTVSRDRAGIEILVSLPLKADRVRPPAHHVESRQVRP